MLARRPRAFRLKSYGAPGTTRTCDPLIRSQVLYPAELRVRGRQFKVSSLKFQASNKTGLEFQVSSFKFTPRMAQSNNSPKTFSKAPVNSGTSNLKPILS